MAHTIRFRWQSDVFAGLPRKDRRSCEYEAYIPDALSGRVIRIDANVAADVADAEAAIARLNAQAGALVDTEALARLLLLAESVASSKIEGLEVGPRRLVRAEAERALGVRSPDVTAAEVLGNIDAMLYAIESADTRGRVTYEGLLDVHRRLLAGTRLEEHGGQIRTEQNWIGGSDYNPCSATYVPPPPGHIERLLQDLCDFCNDEDMPAVAQAAFAHAQFETIHPFVDGNGRTGRALIHMVLRRRGLAPRVLVPVSLILATWATDYIAGLTATRYLGSPEGADAHTGLNLWLGLFATACGRAVDDATRFEGRVRALEDEWRRRLGRVRANSAADLLVRKLPAAPLLTVKSAASLVGRTTPAVNDAVARMVDAGILIQVTVGRRNRAFEARELIDAFTDLERQLASPNGDTRLSPPSRRVPHRRP